MGRFAGRSAGCGRQHSSMKSAISPVSRAGATRSSRIELASSSRALGSSSASMPASVLEGLFFGRIAPHRFQRRTFDMPALVIGHPRDPVHPFSDAGMLADELPNGRLLQASSIMELRLAPERLTNEIAAFLDECWKPTAAPKRRRASA